ncbi:L-lysine exporter family protein LysE/ArgO [Tumebacillus sp. BK434]|uniref:LysE/ArgO family amino acid transporter n=1 Tax=Tumebacillus sp. BK434 TaxID=2512169 RepID=UPI001045850E|nr:LysE family transporter [Tumebacillus sp. BK434]TCP58259.1 L-lysine exporter family protein LysE/ArgO [Tumebacillus sp. BK434]
MAFWHGFLLALGLILPLGVQNVFLFTQGAVQRSYLRALPAVVMAALCDALLILLAVLGVSMLVLQVDLVRYVLLVAGILFLLYMAWMTWRGADKAALAEDGTNRAAMTWRKQVVFAASVSLLNPHAILDTIGVIGTSSLQYAGAEKVWFTLSCMLVSCLWFAGLALAGRVVGKINPRLLPVMSRVSAVIMLVSAVYLGVSLI